jgi:hypothetical protein
MKYYPHMYFWPTRVNTPYIFPSIHGYVGYNNSTSTRGTHPVLNTYTVYPANIVSKLTCMHVCAQQCNAVIRKKQKQCHALFRIQNSRLASICMDRLQILQLNRQIDR